MRCEDCGCGMSGGFCSNCHEEVFIAEQYSDLGEDIPLSIHEKMVEHINDENRIEQAKKFRDLGAKESRDNFFETFGEYPKP